MTKRFELRLCSNGTYYVYENGTLTDVDFDKFNKESADALIDKVNALYNEKEKLKIFLEALNEELDLTIRDYDTLEEENKQLKQQLKLEEAEERINCRNCIYFISGSSSDSCLKREDIGYKGTCIDGMDYHYLAKNCPYY